MTALQLIADGKLRTSRGDKIVRGALVGTPFFVTGPHSQPIETHLADQRAKYSGAQFFGWDDEVPDSVPLGDLSWATAVCSEEAGIGVLITWATPKREAQHKEERLQQNPPVSIEEFHMRRSFGIEDVPHHGD